MASLNICQCVCFLFLFKGLEKKKQQCSWVFNSNFLLYIMKPFFVHPAVDYFKIKIKVYQWYCVKKDI